MAFLSQIVKSLLRVNRMVKLLKSKRIFQCSILTSSGNLLKKQSLPGLINCELGI